jgi:predicted RNA-binding Zn ribbon-like protein
MKAIPASAADMRLIGGRLCLDFINTVDGRKSDSPRRDSGSINHLVLGDKLGEYSDLVEWSRHSGIVTAIEAGRLIKASKRNTAEARDVFDRAIALREALYRICKATMTGRRPQKVDLEIVNHELLAARTHERLTHMAVGFTWEWVGSDAALEVDSGISRETITEVWAAGADTFVAGNAIFSARDPKGEIATLRASCGVPV